MQRTPDAGIKLLLHQKGEITTVGDEKLLEEKGWLVVADLWGQILRFARVD
jgi:hypothetical protein